MMIYYVNLCYVIYFQSSVVEIGNGRSVQIVTTWMESEKYFCFTRYLSPGELLTMGDNKSKKKVVKTYQRIYLTKDQFDVIKAHEDILLRKGKLVMDGLPLEYCLSLGESVLLKLGDFVNIRKHWSNDKKELFPGPHGVCLKADEFVEFLLSLKEIEQHYDNYKM